MSDYRVTIDLPCCVRGDAWVGILKIGAVLIGEVQPDEALSRIKMDFRQGGRVYRLDSEDSSDRDAPIIIDDAVTWVAKVPQVDSFLPTAGKWDWDMEFYKEGSTAPLTLYKGTINVIDDVTK